MSTDNDNENQEEDDYHNSGPYPVVNHRGLLIDTSQELVRIARWRGGQRSGPWSLAEHAFDEAPALLNCIVDHARCISNYPSPYG